MNRNSHLRTFVLSIVLSGLTFSGIVAPAASAQTQSQDAIFALQRGYRTGYSDGYMSGYRDTIDSVSRNYSRHPEYTKADRAYNKEYGTLEDYKDGYKQGFEAGYDTGFERRSFEASLPKKLDRRGVVVGDRNLAVNDDPKTSTQTQEPVRIEQNDNSKTTTDTQPASYNATYQGDPNAIVVIPRETELIIELQEDLNTEQSREGEKFTARIVAPSEIAGAIVEGRVSKIVKPGRLKRSSEMLLSFDRIILNDNRWSNFSAQLTEVMAVKGDNIKKVDNEGTAIGQSSMKGDLIKVGATTGTGALIGGVVGGPVGIAVGAGVGAAFGVGAVVIERGKHVRLNRNQQIRIKTGYETQIR
jgi:hypothetical protein